MEHKGERSWRISFSSPPCTALLVAVSLQISELGSICPRLLPSVGFFKTGYSLRCFRPRGGSGFLLSLISGYLPEGLLNFSYTSIKCNPTKVSSVESPDTGTLKDISVLEPALPLMSWRRWNQSLFSGTQHTSKWGRKDRWLSKSYLPWRFWNPLETETGWCPVSSESL